MNLQRAADRLGVHYQTAYRWVREGRLAAAKQGATYDVAEAEVERFLRQRSHPAPPPDRLHVRSWVPHVARLVSALAAGDEAIAAATVSRLAESGVPAVELCSELIGPAMRAIGEAWHAGRVSVAEEHRATAIIERIVSGFAHAPRGRPRGTAIVTAAPGDLHALPALMAAMALRADRWRVHHLGVNVPATDVVALARRVRADVLVVSRTLDEPRSETPFTPEEASELAAGGTAVLIGEPGARLDALLARARAVRTEPVAPPSGPGATDR